MPKPFDTTLNTLINDYVADWAAFLAARVGVPAGQARAVDTDLSTSLQADRLFLVERRRRRPFGLHLELESSASAETPRRLLRYNVAAWAANDDIPIHSVVVLLRARANARNLTGTYRVSGAARRRIVTFRYTVVRLWEETEASLATAGLGFLPLTMLTDEAAADLPAATVRFRRRLQQPDVRPEAARRLVGATGFLAGLRYDSDEVAAYYEEMAMIRWEDSSAWTHPFNRGREAGVAEGVAQGLTEGERLAKQGLILRLGTKQFGRPTKRTVAAIQAEADTARLDRLADRVLDATGWADLIATP